MLCSHGIFWPCCACTAGTVRGVVEGCGETAGAVGTVVPAWSTFGPEGAADVCTRNTVTIWECSLLLAKSSGVLPLTSFEVGFAPMESNSITRSMRPLPQL